MHALGKLSQSLTKEFLLWVNLELHSGNSVAAPSKCQTRGLAEQSMNIALSLLFILPQILLSVGNYVEEREQSWSFLASAWQQMAVLTPG